MAGVAALAIVLFIVLRPDDEDDSPDTTAAVQTAPETTTTDEATTEESTTEESTTEEAPTTTEAGPPTPQRVVVVVRNGQPVGGVKHAEIEQGEQVLFIVRSDVSDHVHLHGYDLLADVAPGQPARIRFRATEPGVFEAELEDRVVIIAELEVRP
ncbi:MAG TPA: hypothetical protein VJ744_09350 [Gaiellaceae bacterium]|nr:hypothetical protein [Gaiellaceae bacterium]